MTKFSEVFFCPLPWVQVYYSNNNPSPCTIIGHSNEMTVEEWHNSDLLKSIKSDFLQGKVPKTCAGCKNREDSGFKSMRATAWRWNNVGPEPIYEEMPWYGKLSMDTPQNPRRIELRFTNLCNMKCRQCDEVSSSMWAKEKIKHADNPNVEFRLNGHKDLYFSNGSDGIIKPVDAIVESVTNLALTSTNLTKVCFTGGEPFLIKGYYDFLDALIEHKVNEKVEIDVFTNCSTLNDKFTSRMAKFKKVNFIMSVDGVGKAAEYIRHGTDWSVVEKNILHFNLLQGVFAPAVNVAISSYTLLAMSSLATFLMQLYYDNNSISHLGYWCSRPPSADFRNLPHHLRLKAIDEIDKAVKIITAPNYDALVKELLVMKEVLKNNEPVDPAAFISHTKMLDSFRGESFEDVFGINLE
jgi:organic radical activating enzyme